MVKFAKNLGRIANAVKDQSASKKLTPFMQKDGLRQRFSPGL